MIDDFESLHELSSMVEFTIDEIVLFHFPQ